MNFFESFLFSPLIVSAMPTVSIQRDLLFTSLGKTYTQEEFDELCFEFGIELDDVVEEEDKVVYKIDIPANRYDLLCLEGLSRALRVFLKLEQAPFFTSVTPSPQVACKTEMFVSKSTSSIRPFVVCAVLRNLTLDQVSYQSCLDLQDQLHRNICRRRTLVAIGTHDLDSVEGPFSYEALSPEDIKFQHLFAEKEMNGKEMLDWFRSDPAGKHIKEYTDIIYDSPVYPVVFDKNRTVLSMPPIINGVVSKIGPQTKNVFIECTATDMTKAKIVLNTVVAMFARYCEHPDSVEVVQVRYEQAVLPGGETTPITSMCTPDVSTFSATASVENICSTIGTTISPESMVEFCDRMQLGPAKFSPDEKQIIVTVPVTRSDVLHEIDIIEDIAIAFGYNNVPRTIPVSHGAGNELAVNLISDLLRHEVSRQGFTEIMSLGLCSHDENFSFLNRVEGVDSLAVHLSNPKTWEYQVVRTSLVSGLMKTLAENMNLKSSEGIRLFEVTDVVLRDPRSADEKDIGCRNERRLAALHAGTVSSFETIHGLVDRVLQAFAVVPSAEYCPEAAQANFVQGLIKDGASIGEYTIVPNEHAMYFPGRGACIKWRPSGCEEFRDIGEFGVLHPEVVQKFGVSLPCTVLEMNIEPFIRE